MTHASKLVLYLFAVFVANTKIYSSAGYIYIYKLDFHNSRAMQTHVFTMLIY